MMHEGTTNSRPTGGGTETLPELLSANAVTALRRVIIVVILVGGLLAAYNYRFVQSDGAIVYWLTGVIVPFVCYLALKRGKVNVALRLFCWAYWVTICWAGFNIDGIRTPALVAMAPLIMLTAWVQGRLPALWMTLASFAVLVALVAAEHKGWLPSPVIRTPVQVLGTYVQIIGAVSVLAVLIAEHLLALSTHDRQTSADLALRVADLNRSETALKKLNDGLEQRVIERTTEVEKANRGLNELAQFNNAMLMNSPLPMAVYAADGLCVEANEAFSEIQGTTRAGLLEHHNFSIYEPYGLFNDFLEALLNNQLQHREIHDPSLFGRDLWLEYRFVPVEVNGTRHVLIQIVDMTDRRRHEEELRQMAFRDPLTRLPNRRLLRETLNQAIARSTRQKTHGAVLFLDINKFKQLNDTHGHEAGDHLLILVAERLRDAVRATDMVARLGGDEFVVLLEGLSAHPDAAAESVSVMVAKIRQRLSQEYVLGDIGHHGSVSIGVSQFWGDALSVDTILNAADRSMYADKSNSAL